MADETYYAWSRFQKEVNEWGRVTEWINPGDTVSQSDLKVNDEEWKSIVESGAVRTDPYPDIAPDVSPAEHFRANPEEAPTADVDANTPSDEAMAETERADAANQPLGDQQQQQQQTQKQAWEK